MSQTPPTEPIRSKIGRALRLGRAIRLVWESAPRLTAIGVVLILSQTALSLLSLYLMKLVIDAMAAGLSSPDKAAVFGRMATFVGLWGGVLLLSSVCQSVQALVSEAQAQMVTDHVHDILHAKSIEVDLEYYEDPQYFDTLHRAQQEAPFRPTRIVNGLVRVVQSAVSLVGIAGLLSSLHWLIAAVPFVSGLPQLFLRLAYAGKMYDWQRKSTEREREAWYYSSMLTRDQHAKEVRLFNLGSLFMSKFRDLRKQLRTERLRIIRGRSTREVVTQAGVTVVMLGTFVFVAYQAIQRSITLGGVVMFLQAFQRGQGSVQELLAGLAGLHEDNLFLSSLYEFLDLKPKVAQPSHPVPVARPMQTGIVFDHVTFRYPASTRTVLKNVSLSVPAGQVVALVGENGSGKTTLVKLLCRLYDPDDGTITFDGVDLRKLDLTALRREIAAIFQDYAHYNVTAWENIWFGNAHLPADQEEIVAAAQRSGAHDVVSGLPYGYDTVLGKWFEGGEELSIGEWQKMALARAFLRDAQIIVLDEPTSAMDAKAEYEFFARFRQLAEGRSALLISHRFSTVRMADLIYVLERGEIVEHGTHEELVASGGRYAQLFDRQARSYR